MTPVKSPPFRSLDDKPAAAMRRGICPSLQRPMQTGDGLLVRLRPASGGLSPDEMIAIAQASRTFGNGILEVTARGNLQLRGLKQETVEPLTEAIFATGIELTSGLAVETPPLSGVDPAEITDARPMAAKIRAAVEAETPALQLAAKLSVIVDGGGTFNLDGIVADIRLKAVKRGVEILWGLSIGATAAHARPATLLTEGQVLVATMQILRKLSAAGPTARGRDIEIAELDLPGPAYLPEVLEGGMLRPAGLHQLGEANRVAGIGLAFCQARAEDVMGLAQAAKTLGVTDIRLAPEHGLLMPGLARPAAENLLKAAAALGFIVAPDDPANGIALCAGSAGCASAFFDTHAAARLAIIGARDLLDGSFTLHLSACPKGCAHPAPTLLTLCGAPLGYGLVVNGSASVSPQAYIAANDVASALENLSELVRIRKEAGESARACLERLGPTAIVAALRQE